MRDKDSPSEPYIAEVLDLPEHLKVLSVVAIGYPDEQKPPHAKEELGYEKVHRNQYGAK
jgi:nitroreductase